MRRVLFAALAAAVLLTTAPAWAHEEINPKTLSTGTPTFFTLSAANEKKVDLTKVVLTAPSGVPLGEAIHQPPGWTASKTDTAVTWTGGKVPTDEDAVFRFNASLDSSKTYTVKVRQTYSSGKVVDWTGSESSDTPAPLVDGVSSLGGGGTTTLTIVALIVGAVGVLLGIAGLATRGRPLT